MAGRQNSRLDALFADELLNKKISLRFILARFLLLTTTETSLDISETFFTFVSEPFLYLKNSIDFLTNVICESRTDCTSENLQQRSEEE